MRYGIRYVFGTFTPFQVVKQTRMERPWRVVAQFRRLKDAERAIRECRAEARRLRRLGDACRKMRHARDRQLWEKRLVACGL